MSHSVHDLPMMNVRIPMINANIHWKNELFFLFLVIILVLIGWAKIGNYLVLYTKNVKFADYN